MFGPESTTVESDGTVVSNVVSEVGAIVSSGTVVSPDIERTAGLRYPPAAPVVSVAVAASRSAWAVAIAASLSS